MNDASKKGRALAAVCAGITITHRAEGVDHGDHGFDHQSTTIEITGGRFPMHNPKGGIDGWINRYEFKDGMIRFEAVIEDTDRTRKIMGLGALIGPAPRPRRARARRAQTRRRG